RHTLGGDTKASAGQLALAPVQVSATSQAPAAARHTVEDGSKPSAGQSLFTPSQSSATSQGPAAARHWTVVLASAGQAAPAPVQFSVGSHTPAEPRQTVEAGSKGAAGQLARAALLV